MRWVDRPSLGAKSCFAVPKVLQDVLTWREVAGAMRGQQKALKRARLKLGSVENDGETPIPI